MPEKFDKMVESIKRSLKEDHPTWSEKQISSRAYAIARTTYRKKYGVDPL